MISVHFQGKPINITVIPTRNAVPQPGMLKKLKLNKVLYDDLQDLLELTP